MHPVMHPGINNHRKSTAIFDVEGSFQHFDSGLHAGSSLIFFAMQGLDDSQKSVSPTLIAAWDSVASDTLPAPQKSSA
jgi:hypothetical protein